MSIKLAGSLTVYQQDCYSSTDGKGCEVLDFQEHNYVGFPYDICFTDLSRKRGKLLQVIFSFYLSINSRS